MFADVQDPIPCDSCSHHLYFSLFPFRIVCVGVAKVYQFLITTKSFLEIFFLSKFSSKLHISKLYSPLIIIRKKRKNVYLGRAFVAVLSIKAGCKSSRFFVTAK